jgi:photosystem II stability/assembly factor-like uncharacterized protein
MFFKSKKSLLYFTMCAALVSAAPAFPQSAEQWRLVPGPNPEGASITALFSHGGYLFAGGQHAIYRSTDQGQSWKSVNLPEPNPAITSFTAIGGTIFAGASAWPLFHSDDNGLTWKRMELPEDISALFTGDPKAFPPLAITALASIGGSLFAGTECQSHVPIPCGISRSTDKGKTWTRVSDGGIQSLAVIGSDLFAGEGYGGSILRSSDLGNNWTKTNVRVDTPHGPADIIAYNAFAVMGKQLFVGTNYGVFVSTDQGMNWRPINRGIPGFSYVKDSGKLVKSFSEDIMKPITALAVIGDTLFAGARDFGVLRFDSRSQSWTEVNNGLPNLKVASFAVSGGKLFVGTEIGVWVTTDNGDSWKSANSGMNARTGVGRIVVRDNRLLVGAFNGVYASSDNGASWTQVKDSIEPPELQIPPEWKRGSLNKEVNSLASLDDVIIAGTGGGVFRSVDRGQTWEEANQGLPNGFPGSLALSIETVTVIGARIYAGVEDNGLFFSDDQGRSWIEASRDLREMTVKGLVKKGEKLFAATSDDAVFVSLDQGRHWRATSEFFTGKEILSFAGIGDHLLAGTMKGIYFSTDEGQSWTASETGFADLYAHPLVISGAKIYAGTNKGLLVSSNQGRSWTKLSAIVEEGLGYVGLGVEIHALAFSEGNLFAGTAAGVFLSTDDGRSWAPLGMNIREQRSALSLAISGTNVVVGSERGRIYLSPDQGRRWAMVNDGIDPPDRYANPRTIALNANIAGATHLIAATDHGLFVSTNRGQTWRPTNVTMQVYSLKVIGSAIFAGGAGGVLISKDNGLSWTASVAGLNKPYPVEVFAVKDDRIYMAQQGIYVSSDGGRSWTAISDGLPDTRMTGLAVNDTHLFVTTYDGALFARRLESDQRK